MFWNVYCNLVVYSFDPDLDIKPSQRYLEQDFGEFRQTIYAKIKYILVRGLSRATLLNYSGFVLLNKTPSCNLLNKLV